jgi:hypothetical protein
MPVRIDYSKDLKITNVESLPHGTGARFLEVIESHIPNTYIAKQWHRKLTPARGIWIDFGKA